MKKFVSAFWKILFLLVSLPLIKGFYDIFTAPATGLLVKAGADDATLAVCTAIPWLLPLGVLIWLIVDLSKPDDTGSGRINFPGG